MFFQTPLFSIILLSLTVLSLALSIALFFRLRNFMKGSDAKSLEEIIKKDREEVKSVVDTFSKQNSRLAVLENKMKQTVRSVQTIRFNPFPEQGSNQSFATALLDEQGNGVVLSSLYGRDRVSIFAKPIENLTSTYELTVEEKDSISRTKAKQYE